MCVYVSVWKWFVRRIIVMVWMNWRHVYGLLLCVCVNANARGRPCVITIISFSWEMNRSILRMRCLNVWDVLNRESPAMHVAHLKSAPYYVFMKEQQDWQFIIHWTWWEEFTFCCRRGVSELKVRAEIHCKTSSSVHRFISCSKKREQLHKCIFSIGIKALLRTILIWMFFYLALAKLMLRPLVIKFNIEMFSSAECGASVFIRESWSSSSSDSVYTFYFGLSRSICSHSSTWSVCVCVCVCVCI